MVALYGNIEGRILSILQPCSVNKQKLTKDKRVVTDFRHLSVRIVNKLAYLLVRDTFSVLGSSKCKVLSVLDLKYTFHSLRLSENSKRYCGILPYFGSTSYLYQRIAHRTEYFPFYLAILHKHDFGLSPEQEIL